MASYHKFCSCRNPSLHRLDSLIYVAIGLKNFDSRLIQMAFQNFLDSSRRDWLCNTEHVVQEDTPQAESVAEDESEATEVLLTWIRRSISSWSEGKDLQQIDARNVFQALSSAGATRVEDFTDLTADEARTIWLPLADLPFSFVEHLISRALTFAALEKRNASTSASNSQAVESRIKVRRTMPSSFHASGIQPSEAGDFQACMEALRSAKESGTMVPGRLANALQLLAGMPENSMERRWSETIGCQPPALPVARAHWLNNVAKERSTLITILCSEEALWRELGQWRKSAEQYASAVRLWGQAAGICEVEPWPPTMRILETFVFFFRSGASLGQYLSHLRAVLRLLGMDLGVLADTSAVTKGSVKISERTGQGRRTKIRASAEQTRELATVAKEQFNRVDIAESWVLQRHFCMRYGSEVVPLSKDNDHSSVSVVQGDGGRWQGIITLKHRKLQHSAIQVVRNCICHLQGKRLCGVCILRRRCELDSHRLFPDLTYAQGLALLKAAASQLHYVDALSWGTHAFRRGWADEALRNGGPTALFYSGGWRGIAAFSYASAQSRGALAAAEWLVDFSDSSGEE